MNKYDGEITDIWDYEYRPNSPEDSESSVADGSVQNGIASGQVLCIGCGKIFEDFWRVEDGQDPLPVCSECQGTMEP